MSELARMAQEAQRQYEAGETEEGGFAPDGGDILNTELLKQLTRIADALEAQNNWNDNWHTNIWFPYVKQCREEDRAWNLREADLARRELEYQRATALTDEFLEAHPEIFQDMLKFQQSVKLGKDFFVDAPNENEE